MFYKSKVHIIIISVILHILHSNHIRWQNDLRWKFKMIYDWRENNMKNMYDNLAETCNEWNHFHSVQATLIDLACIAVQTFASPCPSPEARKAVFFFFSFVAGIAFNCNYKSSKFNDFKKDKMKLSVRLTKQNWLVCELRTVLSFIRFWF